jgi:hypothetical protein
MCLSVDEIRGKTPAIRLSAKRVGLNMSYSVTSQAKVRFVLFSAGMAAQLLIKLMKRLIRDTGRKVLLILDNLRVHHAQKVKEWLHGRGEGTEVVYLPAYSPELDPDEYLNCDLKAGFSWKSTGKEREGIGQADYRSQAQIAEVTNPRRELLQTSS